jgi:hypothetical protein
MTFYAVEGNYIDFELNEDFEEKPYEILREALEPKYRNLPPRDIERILQHSFLGSVSPEDAENFLRDLGRFATQAAPVLSQVASVALPVVGTAVGTAFGGPVGGALGGALGSAAGGAIGSATAPRPRQTQTPPSPAPVYRPQPPRQPLQQQPAVQAQMLGVAPAAAAQLLATLFQPQVLQALLAMTMGSAGRQTIPVRGNLVPLGAFANLIGTLVNQVEAEYNAATQETGENIPQYLMDSNGEFIVDPAVAEQRAGLLMNLLQQANQENFAQEAVKRRDVGRYRQQSLLTEVDEMYDALELRELYTDLEFWEED